MEQVNQKLIQIYHLPDYEIYMQTPSTSTESSTMKFKEDCITITNKRNILHQLQFNDLIGFNQESLGNNLYRLKFNSFPLRAIKCSKKRQRKVQSLNIWVHLEQKSYQNLKIDLLGVITNRKIKSSKQKITFMIYLNPNAGANSIKHFQNIVNFITLTNLSYEVLQTTSRGHCKQHLNSLDLSKYQGVVIISGDGLMHQFVNSTACGKIPVTHVPGGSGNAFAKAQTSLAGEQCSDQVAIYLAVKGRIRPMNLVKMQLQREVQPIYSFLSLQWAFLADIDMNSQFLRCVGGLRFQIYATYRCLALRRYPCKLTFSTQQVQLPPLNQVITNPSFKVIQANFLNAIFLSIPFISDKYQWAPLLKVEEQAIDMQYITQQDGRLQLIKYLLNSDDGDHFDKEKKIQKQGFSFTHLKLKGYRLQPTGQGQEAGIFGIDGERYESQRMQASISDKKVLTYC